MGWSSQWDNSTVRVGNSSVEQLGYRLVPGDSVLGVFTAFLARVILSWCCV